MGRKLYVGNLGFNVTEQELGALFAEAGSCDSVSLITDKFSGQSRGFGFVEMSTNAEAQQAISKFDGYELQGRALKVNEAKPREDRGGGGGFGGGGGGFGGGGNRGGGFGGGGFGGGRNRR